MRKILYIIRGLPGSGKSHLAFELAPLTNAANDDYFEGPDGYVYKPEEHAQARKECHNRIADWMRKGRTPVAVHNTFIRHVAYDEYVQLAKSFGYEVVVVSLVADLGNVHDVPQSMLSSMAASWEP